MKRVALPEDTILLIQDIVRSDDGADKHTIAGQFAVEMETGICRDSMTSKGIRVFGTHERMGNLRFSSAGGANDVHVLVRTHDYPVLTIVGWCYAWEAASKFFDDGSGSRAFHASNMRDWDTFGETGLLPDTHYQLGLF